MVSFVLLHIHLQGRGCSGAAREKYSNYVNMYVQNTIMLVCVPAVLELSTKDSRYVCNSLLEPPKHNQEACLF